MPAPDHSSSTPVPAGGTTSELCVEQAILEREAGLRPQLARNILLDYRPQAGIRLSPHFYNRDEERDFALEQIARILSTGTWERHLQAV